MKNYIVLFLIGWWLGEFIAGNVDVNGYITIGALVVIYLLPEKKRGRYD